MKKMFLAGMTMLPAAFATTPSFAQAPDCATLLGALAAAQQNVAEASTEYRYASEACHGQAPGCIGRYANALDSADAALAKAQQDVTDGQCGSAE